MGRQRVVFRRRPLKPGWPLKALLCFYPLWWVLGLGPFAFIVFSIPMLWHLRQWRPLRLPPAAGIWALFLGWSILSLVMMPFDAPGTTTGTMSGRILSTIIRLAEYGSESVIGLYVLNLPSREVTQQRIMRWLSVLFIVTIAGGFLGLVDPYLAFSSPIESALPHAISSNAYVHAFVHPQAAQVQDVLGYSAPRPAAPWSFTNFWGNNISILLIWFSVYFWRPARVGRRAVLTAVLLIAVVPIVYSLNRGLWLGLIVSLGFVIWTLATRGQLRGVIASIVVLPLVAVTFFISPLHHVVAARQSNSSSSSNDIRAFLDTAAIKGAIESPILGWGGTRKAIGSAQSIAIGPSASCPNCGAAGIGSTGEFFQVAFSQGLVGVGLYFLFFAATMWRLRRQRSNTAAAARLVCLLAVFYSFFYNALPVASSLTMISIALAWREILMPPPPPEPTPVAPEAAPLWQPAKALAAGVGA